MSMDPVQAHGRFLQPGIRILNRALAMLLAGLPGLAAELPAPTPAAHPVFKEGQAQIVPAFADPAEWIRQSLWVETCFDSDGDGRRDRVFVDVTRPAQTATEGLKVPVVYESSPYFGGMSGDKEILWDVRQELGEPPPPRTARPHVPHNPSRTNVSDGEVKTWVPRGFAVVHSDAPGTGRSQGCVTIGGAPECLAPKAVIDWLNGRARGFTTPDGTEEVTATDWSTGKVGMVGTSYNGTLAVAAATTGVKGLEAIIPVAPNTSYYHYYRSHGLIRHPGGWLGEDIDSLYDAVNSGEPGRCEVCNQRYRDGLFAQGHDRQHGDYNAFWAERDLLTQVGGIRAAVLMAHAFNDWNVVPEHSVRIVNALKGKVPLLMYYHQGGHGGNPPLEMMNRWFTRFLYGVSNRVELGPKAWIVRESSRGRDRERRAPPTLTPYPDYPNPLAAMVTLRPGMGGSALGTLAPNTARSQGAEKLVDNVAFSGVELAKAERSENRLLYATAPLRTPLHLSGTPRITLKLAANKPAANLSVWLVVLPWTEGPIGPANIITRGWADPQNHQSLKRGGDYHSRKPGSPLTPGRFYPLTFDLQPDDQIIPAGKRIGLMIFSSDRDFTLWPAPGTELTLDLDATKLRLPVVGGAAALREAIHGTRPPRF
ncbi:MAG TPA: Xaa-Pro dipeptidyl-peptidase [Verrucomicrobiota bacterium]|nr:Xaa-Pro dipeptidyl-peptidase [Verrucomicrobiota bacterium]HNU52711.1 Xaa-Pro dipeptidyl-peptidase [Verrucomicrobiota bacterium]